MSLVRLTYLRSHVTVLNMRILFFLFHLFFFHFTGYVQGAELDAQEGKGAAALAACRTLAEELTEMRFPAPRILAFKVYLFPNLRPCILIWRNNWDLNIGVSQEGSSQARYFVSRLIPAHKDPPYEQVNGFQLTPVISHFQLLLIFVISVQRTV